MKNFILLLQCGFITLFFSACASLPQSSEPLESVKIEGNFVAQRLVLKNGLKIIVVEDHSSPTFAYQTWFNVGSRNEVIGKTGLAHLFEHMMFKGTKKHPDGEFDRILEGAGAEGQNAFTSFDHTVYVQELPKDKLDLIVELESDRMTGLIVNDDSFKTEREVVQNERRYRKENSAEGTLFQSLFETAFQVHPYHWPVIGYEQDLNLMNAQDARDFYERYYSPDRATVVVVGDVKAKNVFNKINQYYGHLPAKYTKDLEIQPEPPQQAQRRRIEKLNIENEKLWQGYKIPESTHPDAPVFEVIQAILTDGQNSRLNRALVDSGIATNVSSGSFMLKDPGLFTIMVDLQKGKKSLLAEGIIDQELNRLKKTLVDTQELARAKNIINFGFLSRLQSSSGLANYVGSNETLFGHIKYGSDFRNKVNAVTSEEIRRVSQLYLNKRTLTQITGTPKTVTP